MHRQPTRAHGVAKQDFELKEVMDAVGPSAALAFAAWLFLQLLQQRYSAAYSRYRELVNSFRQDAQGRRRVAGRQWTERDGQTRLAEIYRRAQHPARPVAGPNELALMMAGRVRAMHPRAATGS
jgi:hypothetical protein